MPDDLICPKCSATNPLETVFCGKCGSKLTGTEGNKTEEDPFVGAFVGDRFLVHQKLGEGGMGVVYRAEQTAIGRKVALKVLHSHLTRDASLEARFQNEAAACSRLTHPNTVTIYDFGKTDQGALYIAMEYIDGKSLDDEIQQRGAIPWPRACRIAIQICGSLSDAHRHNIVHRDLKPENIMLCERAGESDVVKVLDFGIAKILGEEGTDQRQALTKTGMVFGTPQYMSPEQIRGEAFDHRTDIYSLGVILYEMLTGELPFTSEQPMGVLSKHLFDKPPALKKTNPGAIVPEALELLVMSALAKEADKRPASMVDFKKQLATAADLSQENTLLSSAAGLSSFVASSAAGQRQEHIPATLMQTASADFEPELGRKRFGLVIGVVVAVLILGGVGIGVFLLSGKLAPPQVVSAAQGEETDLDTAQFPVPKPLVPSTPVTGQAAPAAEKAEAPKESMSGESPASARPVKKKKDVPCTFKGEPDSVSAAIRSGLQKRESALKKCVPNQSGGTTVFRFAVPEGTKKPDNIRLVTSSVMDNCLKRVFDNEFDGKAEKPRRGTASFLLERRGGVLRNCEIAVNTQLKQRVGPIKRPGQVKDPQKPGKKDNGEETTNEQDEKKRDLPITITREN